VKERRTVKRDTFSGNPPGRYSYGVKPALRGKREVQEINRQGRRKRKVGGAATGKSMFAFVPV